LPLMYKGQQVGDDLRLDLFVDGKVVVELKAVKCLEPIHEAQLLAYLKLTNCKVGLLINYNVPVLTQGIKRMVR
jgi:GxxExxY protein